MLQVCDHRKECRCEPGWLPPDCETPTESEGSSKGSTTDAAFKIASYAFSFEDQTKMFFLFAFLGVTIAIVVVCVLIGILLIGLAIFFYKRSKSTPHVFR